MSRKLWTVAAICLSALIGSVLAWLFSLLWDTSILVGWVILLAGQSIVLQAKRAVREVLGPQKAGE